jgi:hypothetical protein
MSYFGIVAAYDGKRGRAVLVIAVDTSASTPGRPLWSARRHDDDGPDHSGRLTDEGLFEAVFHALHDGEQVSIGLDCALTAAPAGEPGDDAAVLEQAGAATAGSGGIAALTELLDEIGMWRSWTVVTTSVERWKATTSILVWAATGRPTGTAADGDRSFADAAVDAFYSYVHSPASAPPAAGTDGDRPVLNLVAAAARRAGLQVDVAELQRPVVSIPVGLPVS